MARKERKDEVAVATLSVARRRAILAARSRQLALRAERAASAPRERVLACAVGSSLYGLPLDEVSKVRPFDRRGAAPGADRAALGLIVDHGEIRPALDLARLLGLESAAPAGGGWLLLLAEPCKAALRIDQLPVAVDIEAIEGPDDARARIVGGDHHDKVLVKLSARDLLAPYLSTHRGATAP
jgi:chemotaxis signal transduction protein